MRTGEKATLLAAVSDDLVKRGIKAGDLVKSIAPLIDGAGGGPPTMAQAGGKSPEKLAAALGAAAEWTREYVSAPYEFTVLPGGGHFTADQMPDEVNALMLAHLARNPL